MREKSSYEIEQEPSPICWKCNKPMIECNGYLFPDNVVRFEVPYYLCPSDQTAQIDLNKLKQKLESEKSKFLVEEIVEKFKKEFRLKFEKD